MKFEFKVDEFVFKLIINFKFGLSVKQVKKSSNPKGMIQGEEIRHSQRLNIFKVNESKTAAILDWHDLADSPRNSWR